MSINLSKVAEPYAEALLVLTECSSFEPYVVPPGRYQVVEDLFTISDYLEDSPDSEYNLRKYLVNPLIDPNSKVRTLTSIFSSDYTLNLTGFCIADVSLAFLKYLVISDRIEFFDSIKEKFLELLQKREGMQTAKVTSAIKLSKYRQCELSNQLKAMTGLKCIRFVLKEDPELLGGFTIEIGSTMIDVSTKNQLECIGKMFE